MSAVCLMMVGSLTAQIEKDTTLLSPINDSLFLQNEFLSDSLVVSDSTQNIPNQRTISVSKETLDQTISYSAEDSILYDVVNEMVYLYGRASVQQGKIKLTAAKISINQATQVVIAEGNIDSLGNQSGQPLFSDGTQEFGSDILTYNFKTNKGKLSQLITKQQDGLLRSDEVVKNDRDELFGRRAYYTTCTHEHPHYRIEAKKVKIVPDELIVTGPAQLYIDDIPTPLVLPFGIFPLTTGRKTGVLMPSYGYSPGLGYYLNGGGFYLGINDFFDLTLRSEVYTQGTWSLSASSSYNRRYRYRGSVSFRIGKRNNGGFLDDNFSATRDYRFSWQHSQDPKSIPNRTFSASVNLGTSTYARNFVTSLDSYINNTLNSSISYSQSFPGTPFKLSLSARHNQNNQTKVVNITLPDLSFRVDRQQPFKNVGKGKGTKWLRQLGGSYTLAGKNSATTVDSLFFTRQTLRDLKNGLTHSIPIGTSFNIFKYFTVGPSFNYTEYWYTESADKRWDPTIVYDTTFVSDGSGISRIDTLNGRLIEENVAGFTAGRNFNAGVSVNTRIYGRINTLKIGRIRAFSHVMSPRISYSWTPDFGDEFWGFYKDVQSSEFNDTLNYSIFEDGIFRGPPRGKSSSISLSIDNIFEMKITEKGDTTQELKKVKLLESLSFNTGYNFAADSLNMRNVSVSGRATILNKINFNFMGSFDPYTINNQGRKIDQFYFQDTRKLLRLNFVNFNFNTSFSSKKRGVATSNNGTPQERRDVFDNLNDYVDFNIPWKFTMGYSFRIVRGFDIKTSTNTNNIIQTLNGTIDFNLTKEIKVNIRTGYDFINKELAATKIDFYRNLHCWNMAFNWVPRGPQRRYEFVLRVNSALLQDLKLRRQRAWYDN